MLPLQLPTVICISPLKFGEKCVQLCKWDGRVCFSLLFSLFAQENVSTKRLLDCFYDLTTWLGSTARFTYNNIVYNNVRVMTMEKTVA